MRKLWILTLGVLMLAGCQRYDIDEILLMRNDVSITLKGEVLMSFDPLTCQMSHDKATDTYRVYDDMIADWFFIRCHTRPDYEGQEITADVTWTTERNTKTEKGLTFTVEKTDPEGYIWMWNKSKSIGIVIKNL